MRALKLFFALALLSFPLVAASYEVKMLPPSGSRGERVTLTCGFHGGSCGTGSGNYLDWDNTSSYQVQFRGIFKRSGTPSASSSYLIGKREMVSGGSRRCDIQRVRVVDKDTNTVRAVMEYFHLSMNSTNDFPIQVSTSGVYNTKFIGEIIDDTGCGIWSGTHVHAGSVSEGSSTRSKNTGLFPSGDYCTPSSGNCTRFRNDDVTNWTHRFTWTKP